MLSAQDAEAPWDQNGRAWSALGAEILREERSFLIMEKNWFKLMEIF